MIKSPAKNKIKTIEIVAGPNGSGKSTFAESFLIRKKGLAFVNSDTIASGITPSDPQKAAFNAGRVMLTSIKDFIKQGESFAFETTFSGKTWELLLKEANESGYKIIVYFLYLENPKANLARIKERVKQGGHNIERDIVLRRYPRCFNNFWQVYRHQCDNWFIFNNSKKKPKLIYSKQSYQKLSNEAQLKFEKKFLKSEES